MQRLPAFFRAGLMEQSPVVRRRAFIFLVASTITGLLSTQARQGATQPTRAFVEDDCLKSCPRTIPLTGTWQFHPELSRPVDLALALRPSPLALVPPSDQKHWQPIAVPGNWYLQGHDLYGVVWYRHYFWVDPQLERKVVHLIFEGVDYAADVWLNGKYLGFHEGYFQPFSFLVTEQLRLGQENELIVRVNSPREQTGPDWSLHKRLIKGVLSHHDARPGGAWTDYSQDKNTGGIWAPVYLQVSRKVAIEQVHVTPQVNPVEQSAIAEIVVTLTYPGQTPATVQVYLQLIPYNFPGVLAAPVVTQQQLQPGHNIWHFSLEQQQPEFWWTWEHGAPRLYCLLVRVTEASQLLDQREVRFGFRNVSFDSATHVWKLNGKRLFLRGTNYIASQWLSEMTPEKHALDLALMQQANINAIRVHAHVESQEFYDLCDQLGFLIWQDFPLQWGYTEMPAFAAEAVKQARDMIDLLYNHPAIIAWCLHNEPPWDAEWMRDKYKSYDPEQNKKLDAILFTSLKGRDPTRYLHPYSSVREHPWWGWYFGSFQKYAEPTDEALITEFGAQALPNLRSLRRIFTEAELWPNTAAEWAQWEYHNFQRHETFNIAHVSKGKNPQEFIINTQHYQAQLIQFAAEAYRRQRYRPVAGIFQFMFVECWPSVNWGILDYWRHPKAGYQALKRAYQPVLPSIAWSKQIWQLGETIELGLVIINDLWTAFPEARVSYGLQEGWQLLETITTQTDIEPDSQLDLATVAYQPQRTGHYQFVIRIAARDGNLLGQNTFEFTVKTPEDNATP